MVDAYFEDGTYKDDGDLGGDEAIPMTFDPGGSPADAYTTPDDLVAYSLANGAAGTSATQTLTNKRITKREEAVTVSATPAINVDNGDVFTITSQNADITSMTSGLSGTPTSAQPMIIEILDDGTARAITWGASFASGPATLPTTTITSKWLYVGFEYSASRSKWICFATGSEQ